MWLARINEESPGKVRNKTVAEALKKDRTKFEKIVHQKK